MTHVTLEKMESAPLGAVGSSTPPGITKCTDRRDIGMISAFVRAECCTGT